MCTVSWLHDEGGYELFFNRDERTSRRPAIPPSVRERGGVRFVAPADGDFGGTWVAANEHGLTVALLNLYGVGPVEPPRDARSRGRLVLDLAGARSRAEVCGRLVATGLGPYEPFTLLALAPGEPALVVTWNGVSRSISCDAESRMPLVSSGVDLAEVVRSRARVLAELARRAGRVTRDVLVDFHRSHLPERGSRSACMHRDDASTVSFTHVRVSRDAVELSYVDASPCSDLPAVTHSIARRRARPTGG